MDAPVECPVCKASNPIGKNFCGNCGVPLHPNLESLKYFLETELPRQVQSVLKEQFRDQKLLEVETAQAIVARLSDWAKLFGYFVGVPLALLVIVLGLFGIRSYSDFSGMIKSAQQDVAPKLEQAKRQADEIKQTSAGLKAEYDELKTELSDTKALAQDVKTLSKKVERIEEKVGFKPSAALTPDLQKDLEAALSSFIGYMQKIGFRPVASRVNVYVDPDMKDNVAYYKPDESLVVVGRPYAKDTDAVFREYAFHVLTGSNFGALTLDAQAIESGLADYFPCSYKNKPIFGEEIASHIRELQGPEAFNRAYVRNLKNERKFTESWRERGYQEGGEIWGGAFWEIRSLLGRDTADKVLFTAWHSTEARAGQGDAVTYFVKQLLESDRSLEGEKHVNQIASIFERRGLKL